MKENKYELTDKTKEIGGITFSELSGKCYEAIVRAVEAIEAAKGANDEQ